MLGKLFLFAPIVIIILCIITGLIKAYLERKYEHLFDREDWPKFALNYVINIDEIRIPAFVLSVMATALMVFIILVTHINNTAFIEEYTEISHMYEIREDTYSEIERAALFNEVSKYNATLASKKYYYKHFGIFMPKKIMELERIE